MAIDRKNAASSPKARIYRVGDIVVEPGLALVHRAGVPIEVRPKTYRFLLFLMENNNRLVSKQELVTGVWDGTAVSDDVLVRSAAELRKIFGDDTREPRIVKTFPKLGYGLMARVEIISPEEARGSPRVRNKWRWAAALVAVASVAAGVWMLLQAQPAKPPSYRETAWWKLDRGVDILADAAGRLDGTIHGTPAQVPGKLGGGLRFDRTGDFASGRAGKWLPAGDAARTLTAWVYLSSPRVDPTAIFEYGRPDREYSSARFFLGTGVEGSVRFGSGLPAGQVTGRTRLDDGEWHMIAGTYLGSPSRSARIYVDGVLDVEHPLAQPPDTAAGGWWRIGQHLAFANEFRGAIDDLRVFSRALDASRIQALYRCSAGIRDVGDYYYLPVFAGVSIAPKPHAEDGALLRNDGTDYAGVQLARAGNDCAMGSLRGADAGQDLRIGVDLLVPTSGGFISDAGPFFRSRAAAPGDGIIGGRSAGYWVQLRSNGMIKVRRLNPLSVVAFSPPNPQFDPNVFHRLEADVRGETLLVRLDGKTVRFEQNGKHVEQVSIPAAWEGPPRLGENDGAAGILFGAEENRGKAGGQRARNLVIASR